jgi:hypothetical protein
MKSTDGAPTKNDGFGGHVSYREEVSTSNDRGRTLAQTGRPTNRAQQLDRSLLHSPELLPLFYLTSTFSPQRTIRDRGTGRDYIISIIDEALAVVGEGGATSPRLRGQPCAQREKSRKE